MTAHWTIDDDDDFGPALISPGYPYGPQRARDLGLSDESFDALVADVRAAREAETATAATTRDCPGVPGWVHVRGDKLDRLVAAARLADDMATVVAAFDKGLFLVRRGREGPYVWAFPGVTDKELSPGEVAALHHARQQEQT